MKRILMIVFVVLVALSGAQAEARRVEVNLALPSTMAPSGTSPLGISSMSQDTYLFAQMTESTSGTSDFILNAAKGVNSACWALQVVSATKTTQTKGLEAAYTLSYKVGDVDNTSTEWGELPLIPIISGVSTDSGATPYPLYFEPPPGEYIRFYITSGTTPAYSTFTAKLVITENAKCPDPNTFMLQSSTYTADAAVRAQPGFFHGIYVNGIASGVTIGVYDVGSGSTAGATTLFPETYIPLSATNPAQTINMTPPIPYSKGVTVDLTGIAHSGTTVSYKVYYRDRTY